MSADSLTDPASAAERLNELAVRIGSNDQDAWSEVERTSQWLANALRVQDGLGDVRRQLGKSRLPQSLSSIFKAGIQTPRGDSPGRASALHELLRVSANLCIDHDDNREALLDAGFIPTLLSFLEKEAENLPAAQSAPLPLSLLHLKVVKTAIGVLLNASVNYQPVQSRLRALEAAMTILRISSAIYPTASWQKYTLPEPTDELATESWLVRSGLSAWAWYVIGGLKDEMEPEERSTVSPLVQNLFGPEALPLLTQPLLAYIPPTPSLPPLVEHATTLRRSLLQADFDTLEEVCMLLESLCLDIEDVRLSLARGLFSPQEHDGVPCLEQILDFIERGDYSPLWPEEDRARRIKQFDICKAALIKAIVEVAGEDKNADVIWEESETGGSFISRMVRWLRDDGLKGRDDLVVCATLSLGNLVRKESHATMLVKPPIALTPELSAFLAPGTDIKVKHGVLGLLRNLAIAAPNRTILSRANLVRKLALSEVWSDKNDMAETVQGSAIGVVKYLCAGDVESAFALVLPDPSQTVPTALAQLVALIRRSDTVAIKSEGTRVIANAIKSIWASDMNAFGEQRKAAMDAISNLECAMALAQLIGRSKRYPLLINEGIVSLSLIAAHTGGAALALDALMNPLPQEVSQGSRSLPSSAPASATSESPTMGPSKALDMLATVMANREARFAPEIRANVCMLVAQVGQEAAVGPAEDRQREAARVREVMKGYVQAAAQSTGEGVLDIAAKRTLDTWGTS